MNSIFNNDLFDLSTYDNEDAYFKACNLDIQNMSLLELQTEKTKTEFELAKHSERMRNGLPGEKPLLLSSLEQPNFYMKTSFEQWTGARPAAIDAAMLRLERDAA